MTPRLKHLPLLRFRSWQMEIFLENLQDRDSTGYANLIHTRQNAVDMIKYICGVFYMLRKG